MHIRIECTADGLTGNWLEISDVWSRKELAAYRVASVKLDDATLFTILETKISRLHVVTVDGTVLESAVDLIAKLDDLDVRLVRWLAAGVNQVLGELLRLGETSVRLSFNGVETARR